MAQSLQERTWYDAIYLGVLFTGFGKLYQIFQNWTVTLDESLLLGMAFALLVYYWSFDSWKPGYKTEFCNYSLQLVVLAIATAACFVGMFACSDSITKFIAPLEGMYGFDAWWAHEHGKIMEQLGASSRKRRRNSLIVISNALMLVMLILYSVFFYILMRNSIMFPQTFFTIVIAIAVTAGEANYLLIYRIIR